MSPGKCLAKSDRSLPTSSAKTACDCGLRPGGPAGTQQAPGLRPLTARQWSFRHCRAASPAHGKWPVTGPYAGTSAAPLWLNRLVVDTF
jgi:hypothetical protein